MVQSASDVQAAAVTLAAIAAVVLVIEESEPELDVGSTHVPMFAPRPVRPMSAHTPTVQSVSLVHDAPI